MLTRACHFAPSRRVPGRSTRTLSCRRTRGRECTSSQPRQASEASQYLGQQLRRGGIEAHLLGLALPPLLSLVRPSVTKRGLARIEHVVLVWIFPAIVTDLGLNGCHDGPAAARHVVEVLEDGVVAGLPAVEALVAKVTNNIVGAVGAGVEVETGLGKLRRGVRIRERVYGEGVGARTLS